MRLIDADALKKVINEGIKEPMYQHEEEDWYDGMINAENLIKEQPTVEPQQWIPCSETVDIPDHEILACDKYGEEMFGYLAYEDEQWLCESDGCMMYDPIAWREKPEPWRGEDNERA
jgi:hypothetical protein